MSKAPSFTQLQQGFADHIKNPDEIPRPLDVDERHMSVYRDLFFKNVLGFLSGTFPVLAEIMGESRWLEIGRDFFSKHSCSTPYFLEISREFLQYIETEYEAQAGDPAYIYELAHYEWLELYVDVEPEKNILAYDEDGDVLKGVPLLTSVVEGYLYQYPVHQISKENNDPQPQNTALIVYRKRDDSVAFIETNPFTLQLLAMLKPMSNSGEQVLTDLLEQTGLIGSEAAYQGGIDILNQWQSLGIILGAVTNSMSK